MGQGTNQIFKNHRIEIDVFSSTDVRNDQWVIMDGDDDIFDIGSNSSSFEDSTTSVESSSTLDLIEDASSSTSYSSSPIQSSKGPLYELSELMAQLPIKRGLSKHFEGKSQSFTSLSSVRSIEDLAKRENPCRKKMKTCKSYGGGLDINKSFAPKTCSKIISKKASRGSFSSLLGKRSGFSGSFRPPLHVQRNL